MQLERKICECCKILFLRPYFTDYRQCLKCLEPEPEEGVEKTAQRLLEQVFPDGLSASLEQD